MNLSKKALIAAAVTGMLPNASEAAALDVNLVLNPSFENVVGPPPSQALNWAGIISTYAYSLNYTGPAPGGAGTNYWFGGGADPLATQNIDLSGNAVQIDLGLINYDLSAYFSTYLLQKDYGTVRAIFLDGASMQLGSAPVGGATFVGNLAVVGSPFSPNARAWGQDATSGLLPMGTRNVRIELDGEKEPGIGSAADGYIDLVNFQIHQVPEPGTVALFGLAALGGLTLRWWRRR